MRAHGAALCAAAAAVLATAPASACPCCTLDVCGAVHPPTLNPPASSQSRGGDPFVVSMLDNFYVPAKLIIRPSSVVRWSSDGKDVHTATRKGMFDSGIVEPGNVFDFEFNSSTAGFSYAYTCVLHFGMDGTVFVARYGDANLDGFVGLDDFNVMASNFGQSGPPWEGGDFNEDGTVNLEDFNLLAANFGQMIQPAEGTIVVTFGNAIPEPATTVWTLLGGFLLCRRRGASS